MDGFSFRSRYGFHILDVSECILRTLNAFLIDRHSDFVCASGAIKKRGHSGKKLWPFEAVNELELGERKVNVYGISVE